VEKASVLAALFVAFAASACAKTPTVQECDAALDRYLDMTEDDDPTLTGMTGAPRAGVRASRIADRRSSLAYLNAEKRCMSEVTDKERNCAMKAPSPNEWEACFEFH
jgi:hypothetical protein